MLRAACLSVKFHELSRELTACCNSDDVLFRIPEWVAKTGFRRAEGALADFWKDEEARRIPQEKGFQRETAQYILKCTGVESWR